jgi:hypothetical protein
LLHRGRMPLGWRWHCSGVACVPCRLHRIRAAAVELAAAFLHRNPAIVAAVALLCRAHAIVAAAAVVLGHCHALLLVRRCASARGPQAFGPGLSAHWGCCWCSLFAVVVRHCGGVGVAWQARTAVVSTPCASGRCWGLGGPHVALRVVARHCIDVVVMRCCRHDMAVAHVRRCSIVCFCATLGHWPSLARMWGGGGGAPSSSCGHARS